MRCGQIDIANAYECILVGKYYGPVIRKPRLVHAYQACDELAGGLQVLKRHKTRHLPRVLIFIELKDRARVGLLQRPYRQPLCFEGCDQDGRLNDPQGFKQRQLLFGKGLCLFCELGNVSFRRRNRFSVFEQALPLRR